MPWHVDRRHGEYKNDWPFFDSRLVVETSAQFVAASFRIRALPVIMVLGVARD